MPVEWRLHVMEERLKREVGERFTIESVDLYGLSPLEQHTAIDAIMQECGDFPVVLVDGAVACVGDIDADAIVEAARRAADEPAGAHCGDTSAAKQFELPKPAGGCGCGGGCC